MNDVTPLPEVRETRRRWSRRHLLLFAALLCSLSVALYLRIAPVRRERQLQSASLTRLQALANQEPDDARVLYHLGQRQLAAGDAAVALQTLQRALAKSPERDDVCIAAAEAAEAAKGAPAAFEILERYLEAQPNRATVRFALARMARRHRQWERAYAEARTVTQQDPENASAWHLYGQAAALTERRQEAEPALRKAFALAPRSWETQTGMGDLMVRGKRYSEALPYYRAATRLAPEQALPHLALAQALLQANPDAGALEEARAALLRCRRLRPEIPMTYLHLGECYAKQGRWPEAQQALEEARRRDPANMDVYFELGKVYRRRGNADAARGAFDKHKRLVVFNDERRVLLARIERAEQTGKADAADRLRLDLARQLVANQMYEEAIGHYQRLLLRAPERADLRRALAQAQERLVNADSLTVEGEAFLHRKRYEEAARLFKAALDRDRGNARAWEGLATALAAAGHVQEALPMFLEATKRDPQRPWAQLAVGEAYAQIGLPQEAQRRLQIAEKDDATRESARQVLAELTPESASTPIAEYSRLWLRHRRHPNDVTAREERDAAEERLQVSGELPPREVLQPLLEAAAR